MNDITEIDKTLLEALKVFMHYGYRKTSLDDVAQAVGVSRQTLYQRYTNKETLFKLSLEACLEDSLIRCRQVAKESESNNIEDTLFQIFDIWGGEYVEFLRSSPHAEEVMEASDALVGDLCETKMEEFTDIVTGVLEDHALPTTEDKRISAQKIAEVMNFTAKGLFLKSKSYDHFAELIRTAIIMACKL